MYNPHNLDVKVGTKLELNKDYIDLSLRTRLADGVLDFEEPA